MTWSNDYKNQQHIAKDPNPWFALYLDKSTPIAENTKMALAINMNSRSRRLLLPLVKPFARLGIILVQLLRTIIPEKWQSSKWLHKTIYWGLKHFVKKEARYLIMRHFHIGTEILRFIAANIDHIAITSTEPLKPKVLKDLQNDTFLIHDLNIFNFVIELNQKLEQNNINIKAKLNFDFSEITDGEFEFELADDTWSNCLDLQTAIELYTPLYAFLLSDKDFWRASNSLQLDETIAIYVSKIFDDPLLLGLVNNRHPLVPHSTLQAGYRLMLHGLDAEILHGYIRQKMTR